MGKSEYIRSERKDKPVITEDMLSKIHYLREDGVVWNLISKRFRLSEHTLQQHYKKWLSKNNPKGDDHARRSEVLRLRTFARGTTRHLQTLPRPRA